MPATPGRKKKTAAPPASTWKKKAAAPDESLQDLTNLMGQMNVAKPTESKLFSFPWFSFDYKANGGRDHVTIRMHGLTRPKSHYKVSVSPDGKSLEVRVRIAQRLYSKPMNNAILQALGILHVLSALKNAFEAKVGEIHKGLDDKNKIWSSPMIVPLPFQCEEQIVQWDVIFTPINITELTDEVGAVQFDAIVHVELRSTYVNVDNEEVGNNRVVMLDGDNNGGGMDEDSDWGVGSKY